MSAKITQQQADAAMFVFQTFATDSSEVAQHLGISQGAARTRLAAIENAGLVCADLQEDETGHGLANRGTLTAKHNVWQMATCSYDDTTEPEAAHMIFTTLGVWPTGHAPTPAAIPAATSEEDTMSSTTNTDPVAKATKAPAKAKASGTKAAKAPAAPKVLSAKAAGSIKPASHLKAEQAARVGADAGADAPGYIVRWPKATYDLLLKTDAAPADAPKWLVRCNEHGTTTPTSGTLEGGKLGSKAGRLTWCKGCKADAAKAAKTAAKA